MSTKYERWHQANQRYTYDPDKEKNPRDVALRMLLPVLKKHLPAQFAEENPLLLELGCGPGYILESLSAGLRRAGTGRARLRGVDKLPDYVAKAGARFDELGEDHRVVEGDVFADGFDPLAACAGEGAPKLCIASHIGYYGYKNKGDDPAQLERLVQRVAGTLGKDSLGLFIHICDEAVDACKRPCAEVMESDTGKIIPDLLRKNRLPHVSIRFARDLRFPKFPNGDADAYWEALATEAVPDETGDPYPGRPLLQDARYLLEFAIHKDLAELGPDQRRRYVEGVRDVLSRDGNVLRSVVEICIVPPENTPRATMERLRAVTLEVQAKLDGRFGAVRVP